MCTHIMFVCEKHAHTASIALKAVAPLVENFHRVGLSFHFRVLLNLPWFGMNGKWETHCMHIGAWLHWNAWVLYRVVYTLGLNLMQCDIWFAYYQLWECTNDSRAHVQCQCTYIYLRIYKMILMTVLLYMQYTVLLYTKTCIVYWVYIVCKEQFPWWWVMGLGSWQCPALFMQHNGMW